MTVAASNPLLVGQIALHEGYVTPDQLEECVRLQEGGRAGEPVGELLVAKGYLKREHLEEIVRIQRTHFRKIIADPARGGLFGQICLRLGYVTGEQLNGALREQARVHEEGGALRLGQLLLRKGFLSPERFVDVLRRQRKQVVRCPACDAFYDVPDGANARKFTCSECDAVVEVPAGR